MLLYVVGGLLLYNLPKIYQWYNELDAFHNGIFKTIGTEYAQFYIDDNLVTIKEVENEYRYYDLRPTDIVLDIGSCIGAFSLKVCNQVSRVYAIEPAMIEELQKNIHLNDVKNIIVLDCVLGDGIIHIKWKDKKQIRYGLSLQEIINICGSHVDFLKCDCEGGEWSITLPEIMNIRRIEAELHGFSGKDYKDFENLLISAGFEYTKRMRFGNTMLISAKNRYID